MRDRIDEAVVLLIAPDFPHQKNRVQHQSGSDGAEKHDAEKKPDPFAPVEDNPAEAYGSGDGRQAHAKHQKEDQGATPAGDAHSTILPLTKENPQARVFESDSEACYPALVAGCRRSANSHGFHVLGEWWALRQVIDLEAIDVPRQ